MKIIPGEKKSVYVLFDNGCLVELREVDKFAEISLDADSVFKAIQGHIDLGIKRINVCKAVNVAEISK